MKFLPHSTLMILGSLAFTSLAHGGATPLTLQRESAEVLVATAPAADSPEGGSQVWSVVSPRGGDRLLVVSDGYGDQVQFFSVSREAPRFYPVLEPQAEPVAMRYGPLAGRPQNLLVSDRDLREVVVGAEATAGQVDGGSGQPRIPGHMPSSVGRAVFAYDDEAQGALSIEVDGLRLEGQVASLGARAYGRTIGRVELGGPVPGGAATLVLRDTYGEIIGSTTSRLGDDEWPPMILATSHWRELDETDTSPRGIGLQSSGIHAPNVQVELIYHRGRGLVAGHSGAIESRPPCSGAGGLQGGGTPLAGGLFGLGGGCAD